MAGHDHFQYFGQGDVGVKVPVSSIQRFCPHDGPGIRTVVFFKGCPLRCVWCHNPETQSAGMQIYYRAVKCISCGSCTACPNGAHSVGTDGHIYDREKCVRCGRCAAWCPTGALENALTEMTEDEVVAALLRDKAFYGDNGGVTLSGGEPMAHPDAAIAVLSGCKRAGVRTAVETCGRFDGKYIDALAKTADLLLYDVKLTDDRLHEIYTGSPFGPIRDNLLRADERGIGTVLRCILIRGINDTEEHFSGIARLYRRLHHCLGAELLPYHVYGADKAKALGMAYEAHSDWIPSEDGIAAASRSLSEKGVNVLSPSR